MAVVCGMVLLDLVILVVATAVPSTRMEPHFIPDVERPGGHVNVCENQLVKFFAES